MAGREALPMRQKLGYAVGGSVDGIIFNSILIYTMFYLTEVAGLPPAAAGTAIAIGLITDALASPFLGLASDRLEGRWGRRLPVLVLVLPPLLVMFVLSFSLRVQPGWPALIVASALLVGLRLMLAAYQLTHLALGAELSADYVERFSVMAWRWTFNVSGGAFAMAVGLGGFLSGDGLRDGTRYQALALVLVAVALAAATVSSLTVAKYHAAAIGGGPAVPEEASAGAEFRAIWRARSSRVLLPACALIYFGVSLNTALNLHAKAYFWGLDSAGIRDVTLSHFAGLACAGLLARGLFSRMEKRSVACCGVTLLAAMQAAPVLLRLAGRWSLKDGAQTLALCGFALFAGIAMGCAGIALNSMLADVADELRLHTGKRREALLFATVAFANKLATALGALLAGWWMACVTMPVRHAGTLPPMSYAAASWLGFGYGPGAALAWCAALVPLWGYRIDRATHAATRTRLSTRTRL